jgi:uncharacterized protein YkwD
VKAKQTKKRSKLRTTLHRHIKLAIVPHSANQYRPHLIRRYGLAAVLVVIIAVQAGYNFVSTGTVLGDNATVTTNALLQDTNDQRAKEHLSPLKLDDKLSQAAFLKAQDMFQKQYWAHNAPDGTTPWRWFGDAGYNYAYAGENLAKNFKAANTVLAAWMASPQHKANVLNEHYSDVGFAVVDGTLEGKNATIIVALYGAPASSAVAGAKVTGTTPVAQPVGLMTRLGVAVQALSPSMLGALVVILIVAGVALVAHVYRGKLPKKLRQSWYRHHGLVKAGGLLSVGFIILVLQIGGQV